MKQQRFRTLRMRNVLPIVALTSLSVTACGDPMVDQSADANEDASAPGTEPEASEQALFWRSSSSNQTRDRSVKLPTGDTMHYTETGPADGKPILFVHGYPTSAYLYRDVVKEVCGPSGSPYRCIALSQIGFGDSSCPGDGRSVDPIYLADRIEEFISLLDLDDFALVVHDWGGPTGMAAGLRHVDRMSHLVILNTFIRIDGPLLSELRDIVDLFVSNGPAIVRPIYPDFVRFVMQTLTSRHLPLSVTRQYVAPYRQWFGIGSCRLRASLNLFAKSEEAESLAVEIEQGLATDWAGKPTVFFWGAEDPLLGPITDLGREAHDAIAALVPQAEEIIIAGANHYMQEDKSAEISQEIVTFLEE